MKNIIKAFLVLTIVLLSFNINIFNNIEAKAATVEQQKITFDPTQGNLSLTNENMTVSGGNGIRILNSFKQTGKWYVEFKMELSHSRIGLAQEGITFGVGHSTNKDNFWFYKNGTIGGGALPGRKYSDPIKDTDIVGMLLDLDEGKVEFSINGVSQGVVTTELKSLFTKQIYIYAGGGSSSSNTSRVTAYVDREELNYLPEGYSPLSENDNNTGGGEAGGGELGNGDSEGGSTNKVKLFSGNNALYKLDENGNIFAWGNNSYGQLGLGDTENRSLSTKGKVAIFEPVSDLIIGERFVIALCKSGNVYAWGDNTSKLFSDSGGIIPIPIQFDEGIGAIIKAE